MHHKGERIRAKVISVEVENERISLSIKELDDSKAASPAVAADGGHDLRKNQIVTATVLDNRDGGIEVQVGEDGPTAFIKRGDLSRDRDEQRAERFQVGQKVDAMVIGFERGKKPMLSIKAMQITEEKQAVAQYGSSDSGASLGDILGAALNRAKDADKA